MVNCVGVFLRFYVITFTTQENILIKLDKLWPAFVAKLSLSGET